MIFLMEETDIKHDDDTKNVKPVHLEASGEGLPYAPENFPNEGDNWRWRVGKRVNVSGYHQDRFIYPPKRFLHFLKEIPTRGGGGLASKLSVKRFVEYAIPGADIDAFFESFTWKIPSKKLKGSMDDNTSVFAPKGQIPEQTTTDSILVGCCKARNTTCSSNITKKPTTLLLPPPMPCDICCSEVGFCRDCCCILCCKTVDNSFQGYSYIKCEALVGDDYTCCHVAHLDCAVRCYMAGTVGGSIGLDAEYYCRRCDAKTDLVSHVVRMLETCKSSPISSYEDIERVLNVGACVLHGSQKASAKSLLSQIRHTLTKLKHGLPLEDIWNEVNDSSVSSPSSLDVPLEQQQPRRVDDRRSIQYLNLDKDVENALQALRKAQESEYKAAEERFHGQKEYLNNLYQQLEHESCQLRKRRLSSKGADLMRVVSDRKDQIEREFKKLRVMEQVAAGGFARASRDSLKTHFGMEQEEEEEAK